MISQPLRLVALAIVLMIASEFICSIISEYMYRFAVAFAPRDESRILRLKLTCWCLGGYPIIEQCVIN